MIFFYHTNPSKALFKFFVRYKKIFRHWNNVKWFMKRYLESKCHKYLNFWKLLRYIEKKLFHESENDWGSYNVLFTEQE